MWVSNINRYSCDAGKLPDAIDVPDTLVVENDTETTSNNIVSYIKETYGREPSAFRYRMSGYLVGYRKDVTWKEVK